MAQPFFGDHTRDLSPMHMKRWRFHVELIQGE
jgi:hypothetical protein